MIQGGGPRIGDPCFRIHMPSFIRWFTMQCLILGSRNVDWGIVGRLCMNINMRVGVSARGRVTSQHSSSRPNIWGSSYYKRNLKRTPTKWKWHVLMLFNQMGQNNTNKLFLLILTIISTFVILHVNNVLKYDVPPLSLLKHNQLLMKSPFQFLFFVSRNLRQDRL
jgi:hypothetical protein